MDKTTKTAVTFLILLALFVVIGIVFSMLQQPDIEPIKIIRLKKTGSSSIARNEYVTNLADNTIVKVKLRFEGDKAAEKELTQLWPVVRYHCLAVLRGMGREDFNRPEGIQRFKQLVLKRINNELVNGEIHGLYITELVLY